MLVSYPTRATVDMHNADYKLILAICGGKDGNRVACIKFVRERYSLGLYEAKQIVDTIAPREMTALQAFHASAGL
jgi:ribosomal protein L7/L12